MSIKSVLEQHGVTREEFNCLIKSKKIINNGNTAEIRRKTDGTMVVYEVKKEKR